MKNKRANQAGKGDRPRPVNKAQFDQNYESIFGKKKFNGLRFKSTYPDDPKNYKCIMLMPGESVVME